MQSTQQLWPLVQGSESLITIEMSQQQQQTRVSFVKDTYQHLLSTSQVRIKYSS